MRGRRPVFANGQAGFVDGFGARAVRRLGSPPVLQTRIKSMKNLIFAAKPLALDMSSTLRFVIEQVDRKWYIAE